MNVTVAKYGSIRPEPAYVVYVGRTRSVGQKFQVALPALSNPFPVTDSGRQDCIQAYRRYLWRLIQSREGSTLRALKTLQQIYREHGKLVLVCHCAPAACHADVIKACLEWLAG